MKKSVLSLIIGLSLTVFNGCSPINFYSNSGLSEKTGLKYYTDKPYLLVERDSENGRILKATFVYLPDLANPQYMVINGAQGSGRAEIKLKNGSVSSLGMSSDSKIARTTEALAELVSEGTDAITDLELLKGSPAAPSSVVNVELYELVFSPQGTTVKRIEIN
ncbi:MAG TPA: hypothetical protein PKM69_07455 [Bacteroidales bacterium]|nr:hypothetical protein [Bacteroidales bacterium]